MNLAERKKLVGSLCIFGFEGTQVPDYLKTWIEDWSLGGVILFKKNVESLEQVANLNTHLSELAHHQLIISVDHEGGLVFRLPKPFTSFPPLQKIGDRIRLDQKPNYAFEQGKILASELCAVGFNLNWAPVTDVDTNAKNPIIGERALSKNPHEVAAWVLEFLKGMDSVDMPGCAKHFPGHGDTEKDSHLDLPVVDKSMTELEACELIPFVSSINWGVPWIMSAHVKYPQLDAEYPATLSKIILTELLREKLAYQGLIVSDDFVMKGIADYYPIHEATEYFLRAGGDVVMICHHEEIQTLSLDHLLKVSEKDPEFEKLLLDRQKRILAYKKHYLKKNKLNQALIGCVEHQNFAQKFA